MSDISPRAIRAMRAALGETQDEFGRRFGASRQRVANWEFDRIGPPKAGPTRMLIERVMAELEPFMQEPVK